MPTNEERREISARLRETILTEGAATIEEREGMEPAVAARFVAIPSLVAALNFDKNIVSIRELTDRLADLIEPEPKRTCLNLGGEEGTNYELYDFGCSSCGYCGDITEPAYCPGCGAKVMDDER